MVVEYSLFMLFKSEMDLCFAGYVWFYFSIYWRFSIENMAEWDKFSWSNYKSGTERNVGGGTACHVVYLPGPLDQSQIQAALSVMRSGCG